VLAFPLEFRRTLVSKTPPFLILIICPYYFIEEEGYGVVSKLVSKSKFQNLTIKMSGEGDVQGQKSLIRLHLHQSEERAYHGESLFPIAVKRGDTKIYFHAKSYILILRITLTVGLTKPKADSSEIGKIIGSDVTKLKELEIGNAQAWYYPVEKALVLWECYPYEQYAKQDPRINPLLATLWQGFEKHLLKELPDTTRIYTGYEPIYENQVYQTFLAKQGYHAIDRGAFVKEVT
jgi:hypothetical protein